MNLSGLVVGGMPSIILDDFSETRYPNEREGQSQFNKDAAYKFNTK